jgi:hypothetical protein
VNVNEATAQETANAEIREQSNGTLDEDVTNLVHMQVENQTT